MFTSILPGTSRKLRSSAFTTAATLATTAVAALAVSVTTAAAAAATPAGDGCSPGALSQPFAAWGDPSSYEAVPGGNFAGSLAGWSLAGGAATTTGNEPFDASGAAGDRSLLLRPGASAQSPATCVTLNDPTFRFFARTNGLLATVAVSVVYPTILGTVSRPLGVVALSPTWQPTLTMLTGSIAGDLLSGGTAQLSLRFTALTGDTQVDDVFVDPRGTR